MRDGIVSSAAVTPVWPENQLPLQIFAALQTQWRSSFAGPTGLDYAAVPVVMDLYAVPADRRRQAFEDLRIMEAEALKVIADGRQHQQNRSHR